MIDGALTFLRKTLNAALRDDELTVVDETTAEQDLVVFVDGDKMEPLSFKLGVVSFLLVNIQQESTMRRADPHRSITADGKPLKIAPETRLDLSVLFVARFKEYEVGLRVHSGIVQTFQENLVFTPESAADLPEGIERLQVEFVSLPFPEQNEIWNALRTTYHPLGPLSCPDARVPRSRAGRSARGGRGRGEAHADHLRRPAAEASLFAPWSSCRISILNVVLGPVDKVDFRIA